MVSRYPSQIGLVYKPIPVLLPSHLPILVFKHFLVILWIISSVVAFGYWSCVGLIFLLLLWSRFILILFILRYHSLFMNIFALFYPLWTYYIYFILCHFCDKKGRHVCMTDIVFFLIWYIMIMYIYGYIIFLTQCFTWVFVLYVFSNHSVVRF